MYKVENQEGLPLPEGSEEDPVLLVVVQGPAAGRGGRQVVEPPRHDEGKRADGVREENDTLTDRTSETEQSLPTTSGLSPECKSVQGRIRGATP